MGSSSLLFVCLFFFTTLLLQDWIVQYDPPDNPKVITSPLNLTYLR
jgi:hypothetical protein